MTLKEIIAGARQGWREQMHKAISGIDLSVNSKDVRKEVLAMLTKERREIMFKLLGLTTKQGRLEVDPKRGDSIMQRYITDQVAEAVTLWFETKAAPALSNRISGHMSDDEVIKAIEKSFMSNFQYRLDTMLHNEARRLAEEHAERLKKEFRAEFEEAMTSYESET